MSIAILNTIFKPLKNILKRNNNPFVYVAMGDSTVEGFGASTPERTYPGIIFSAIQDAKKDAEYYNLGKSNSKITDVLEQQVGKAITYQPKLVTLSIGANDVRKSTSLKSFTNDLESVLQTLKNETSADIVINTIPDFSLVPAVPKQLKTVSRILVSRYNERIKKIAKKSKVIVVDLYTYGRIYTKQFPEIVYEDGFHPSDFGYALWANTILTVIYDLLFLPRKRWFW